jgi:Asp-tRNA(Asn)/Glu-tRNA(Gln) amidotransferase A subunit family amidase
MGTSVRLNQLSATAAAAVIATGKVTSETLVAACLERIAQREDEVRAWAFVDPEVFILGRTTLSLCSCRIFRPESSLFRP